MFARQIISSVFSKPSFQRYVRSPVLSGLPNVSHGLGLYLHTTGIFSIPRRKGKSGGPRASTIQSMIRTYVSVGEVTSEPTDRRQRLRHTWTRLCQLSSCPDKLPTHSQKHFKRPRRTQRAIRCCADCSITETAAHIIQGCFRTHGGRSS